MPPPVFGAGLALVSIPVEIYPATKSGASISFHQVRQWMTSGTIVGS